MLELLLVGAGGFIGANLRFITANRFMARFGTAFPYGTLFINLTGSFLLGLFTSLATRSVLSEQAYRLLFAVGFCGGYTTFSTLAYETLILWQDSRKSYLWLINLVGSYLLGLLMALLGSLLG